MSIHLARDGSALGVFSDVEVREGLASGRFRHDDLAWREGMPAWVALVSWPEFATVGGGADAPQGEATLPWEQGKSPQSFLATVRLAIFSPTSALAGGRYAFGDWVAFAYTAFGLVLPLQIVGTLLGADRNQETAELLAKFGFGDFARQFAEQSFNLPLALVSLCIGTLLLPLAYSVGGLLLWVFQRMFGYKVAIERTVSACLLAAAVTALVTAPLNLLAFSIMLQVVASLFVLIPAMMIYYRALGGAVGISPWVLFGINMLLWFLLCCFCCALPLGLLGVAAAHG